MIKRDEWPGPVERSLAAGAHVPARARPSPNAGTPIIGKKMEITRRKSQGLTLEWSRPRTGRDVGAGEGGLQDAGGGPNMTAQTTANTHQLIIHQMAGASASP